MNFLVKSISLIFILCATVAILILNIQWGRKGLVLKNFTKNKSELYRPNRTVFVALFELKKDVMSGLEQDFKKRKKVRLNYE